MIILLDTNVLISAIISHGVCFELFEYCIKNHKIIASNYIINEFIEKLDTKFKFTKNEIQEARNIVFEKIIIVEIENIICEKIKNQDDLPILGTAIARECDCIITGDKELQNIKKFKNIDIISPGEFWEYETKKRKE